MAKKRKSKTKRKTTRAKARKTTRARTKARTRTRRRKRPVDQRLSGLIRMAGTLNKTIDALGRTVDQLTARPRAVAPNVPNVPAPMASAADWITLVTGNGPCYVRPDAITVVTAPFEARGQEESRVLGGYFGEARIFIHNIPANYTALHGAGFPVGSAADWGAKPERKGRPVRTPAGKPDAKAETPHARLTTGPEGADAALVDAPRVRRKRSEIDAQNAAVLRLFDELAKIGVQPMDSLLGEVINRALEANPNVTAADVAKVYEQAREEAREARRGQA